MNSYIGTTRETASWLAQSKDDLRLVAQHLRQIHQSDQLRDHVYAAGSVRLAADQNLTLVWNTEYSTQTGSDAWLFARLDGAYGLLSNRAEAAAAFERCINLAVQRLNGLLLPSTVNHRGHSNGVHTCLVKSEVWRENEATERLRVAYYEAPDRIVAIGPCNHETKLVSEATKLKSQSVDLFDRAGKLINETRKRSSVEIADLKEIGVKFRTSQFTHARAGVPQLSEPIAIENIYKTLHLSYEQWDSRESSLTTAQRTLLQSDVLYRSPLRVVGPAGSGKTLILQLLAIRMLNQHAERGEEVSISYVVHNNAMKLKVINRFETLTKNRYQEWNASGRLNVLTLFDYCIEKLDLQNEEDIYSNDAQASKDYQLEQVVDATTSVLKRANENKKLPLISQIIDNPILSDHLAGLIASEISVTIKGRGLTSDRKSYCEHEKPLSLLHGNLTPQERELVFDIYEQYQHQALDQFGVLDTDDVALTMLQTLRTPLWEKQRKTKGSDFCFVDETQLFNENERRVFPWLLRGDKAYAAIALGLDPAQDIRGQRSAGFAHLGIKNIADQDLPTIHRSTKSILSLAFNVIQQTTDLFGPDFPDFTSSSSSAVDDVHELAHPPTLVAPDDTRSLGKHVRQHVEMMRRKLRQIAVVVHANRYWNEIEKHLCDIDHYHELKTRGEPLESDEPMVVLSTADLIGGQEFDGVISVGLEQGVVPPHVQHQSLAAVLEEQALREVYLTFTRARFQLFIWNSSKSAPARLLQNAIHNGLLTVKTISSYGDG